MHTNQQMPIKKDLDEWPVERDIGAVVAAPRKTAGPSQKKMYKTAAS